MRKAEHTQEEIKEITNEILAIRERTGLKNSLLRDFMKMGEQTFRNNLSSACNTNNFRRIDLENLKEGVKIHFENYNHNL
jgi:hypothetical protein